MMIKATVGWLKLCGEKELACKVMLAAWEISEALGSSMRIECAVKILRHGLTRRYESAEDAQQTRGQPIRTVQLLLQRPPLAMFDPSLIHRNDEIFNPEPNRLGIFFV